MRFHAGDIIYTPHGRKNNAVVVDITKVMNRKVETPGGMTARQYIGSFDAKMFLDRFEKGELTAYQYDNGCVGWCLTEDLTPVRRTAQQLLLFEEAK